MKSEKYLKKVISEIKTGEISPDVKEIKEKFNDPKLAFLILKEFKKQLLEKSETIDKDSIEFKRIVFAKELIDQVIENLNKQKKLGFKGNYDFSEKINRIWKNEEIFNIELNYCLMSINREKRMLSLLADAETKKKGKTITPYEIEKKINKEVSSFIYPTDIDFYLKPIPQTQDEVKENLDVGPSMAGGLLGMSLGPILMVLGPASIPIGLAACIAGNCAGAVLGYKSTEYIHKNLKANLEGVDPEEKQAVISENDRIISELTPVIKKSIEEQEKDILIKEAYRIVNQNMENIEDKLDKAEMKVTINITKSLLNGITNAFPSNGFSLLTSTASSLNQLVEYDQVEANIKDAKTLITKEFKNAIKRALIIKSLKKAITEGNLTAQDIKRQLTLSNY